MDHISYSSANQVLKCGIQYEFRKVKNIIVAPSGALVRGTCGHKAVERNLRQKIDSETDLPMDEVVQAFADEWSRRKYEVALTPDEIEQAGGSADKAMGRMLDSGVKMVSAYHSGVAPSIKPLAVEEEFRVDFHDDFPGLVGVIDVRERDQSILDSKFVSKSPSKGDIDTDVQLQTYQLGIMAKRGVRPPRVRKIWAVDLKEAKAVVQEREPYPDDTLQRLLKRYEAAVKSIKSGVFAPAPAGVWWCSEKWCGYWRLCKYHP